MTKLAIAIIALVSLPAFAQQKPDALHAQDEATFLARAGSEWRPVGAGRYEKIDARGRRIEVGFGEDVVAAEIGRMKQQRDELDERQQKLVGEERRRVQHSIRQLDAAIGHVEGRLAARRKGTLHEDRQMDTCYGATDLDVEVDIDFNRIYSFPFQFVSTTVVATGPSFGWDPGPSLGDVTVTAAVGSGVNSETGTIHWSYNGEAVSEYYSSGVGSCGATPLLRATAIIVPPSGCPMGARTASAEQQCQNIP